jgi:hypothetical protein
MTSATPHADIDAAVAAVMRYLTVNPYKHGIMTSLYKDKAGEWQKTIVTNDGEPVTRELVKAHLEGNADIVKHGLGYLAGTEEGTNVGCLDLDRKNYAGDNPDTDPDTPDTLTLEDARQRVLDVCGALGLHIFCEESVRGGWHLWLFLSSLLPYSTVRKALRELVRRAGLAASATETYPKGDDHKSAWTNMPYYGAAKSQDGLGRTFLQTADGEAVRFNELEEWLELSDASVITALADSYVESAAGSSESTAVDLSPEGLDLLIDAVKEPDLKKLTDRHAALAAVINLAARMGRKVDLVKALQDERVGIRTAWIKDGSRDAKKWADEVQRWAKEDKSDRKRGIKFLLEQGFIIPDLPRLETTTTESAPWPEPLDEAAYHGILGEVVRLIAPHTEADEAALLFQLLAEAGNAVGRNAYYLVESDRHHANLDITIVGNSAKGRKGTSQGRVKAVMMHADPAWSGRIVSGLSSGEGLIWAVRDAIIKTKKTGEEEVVDEGVADKRLMVLESELSSALKVMSREGNTLSATVRNAWDTGTLRTLTKNSPARATDAHISIIGHITKNELLRHLDATEMANGFANRFLWICVRRSKLLPFGGDLNENDIANIGVILADRLEQAKSIGRVTMDAEARADWATTYTDLSEAKPGLFGSIIARSEAQVLRLALIYALFDASSVIRRVHLEAGLACWDYAEASARYLFSEALGNPMADTILQALKAQGEKGMTRTEIRDLFDRHAKTTDLDKALKALTEANLARKELKPREKGPGKPTEVWYAL